MRIQSRTGSQPKIAALSRTQTLGQQPTGIKPRPSVQDDDALNPAVLSLLGIDPESIKQEGE